VPLCKRKILLLIAGSIGFVAGGIFVFSISESQMQCDPLIAKIGGILGVLFFGLCGLCGIIKLFDTKPGLILDSEGIIDNSSGVSAGRIPWNEIIDINTTVVANQNFLVFHVTNPEKYVGRGNYFKRKINAANLKYFNSPIHISANTLKNDFDALTELILGYYQKYGKGDN
jgi:hypothetical protein